MEQIEAYRILIDIRNIIDSARIIVECHADLSSKAIGDFRLLGDLAKSIEAYAMITKDIVFMKEVEQSQRYSIYDVLNHYELDEVTRDSLIKCLLSFAHIAPQNLEGDNPKPLIERCVNKDSTIEGHSISIIQEANDDNISGTHSILELQESNDEKIKKIQAKKFSEFLICDNKEAVMIHLHNSLDKNSSGPDIAMKLESLVDKGYIRKEARIVNCAIREFHLQCTNQNISNYYLNNYAKSKDKQSFINSLP